MIERQTYVAQFNEVREKYEGAPVEVIRKDFAHDITNDEDFLIDTNYKDILVTFSIKDGKCYLTDMVELYDENGIFVGTMRPDGSDYI